jgi:hypothetical protein
MSISSQNAPSTCKVAGRIVSLVDDQDLSQRVLKPSANVICCTATSVQQLAHIARTARMRIEERDAPTLINPPWGERLHRSRVNLEEARCTTEQRYGECSRFILKLNDSWQIHD